MNDATWDVLEELPDGRKRLLAERLPLDQARREAQHATWAAVIRRKEHS